MKVWTPKESRRSARVDFTLYCYSMVQYRPLYFSLAMQLCVCVEISVPPLGTFIIYGLGFCQSFFFLLLLFF